MSIEASLAACEEIVRHADPDRYLSALFAPAERRPLLFVLYAFNHELARIGETVKEPMAGAIRLQWWRETLESARDGRPRAQDVARGLAEVFARAGPPLDLFEPLLSAREFDVGQETFTHLADLEAYGDATAGTLMRIAARLLDEHMPEDILFRHAGTAYALMGILLSWHRFVAHAQGKFMPATLNSACRPASCLSQWARSSNARWRTMPPRVRSRTPDPFCPHCYRQRSCRFMHGACYAQATTRCANRSTFPL